MKKVSGYVLCLFIAGILVFPALPSAQEQGSQPAETSETGKAADLGEWWLRNPLTYKPVPEQFLYHLEADYSWTRNTGNQTDDSHSLSALLTLRKKIFTYNLRYTFDKQNSAKRGNPPKQDMNVTLRKSTKHEIHNDFRVALTEHLFFSPGIFWLEDDYSQIKDRYTYYAGFGYALVPHPRLRVNVFGAYAYEELDYIDDYHEVYKLLEDWEKEASAPDYDPGTKRSKLIYLYEDVRFYLTRSVALNHSMKYFRDTDDSDKYRWNFSVGADIKITEHILATFNYNEDYDNAPESIMGLRKRDTSIGAGVKLSF